VTSDASTRRGTCSRARAPSTSASISSTASARGHGESEAAAEIPLDLEVVGTEALIGYSHAGRRFVVSDA
jgi:hypothetical protein